MAGCAGSQRETVPARELTPPPAGRDAEQADPGIRHTVEAGQTLWRIARVYGVTLEELTRVNRIDQPTSLEIGRRLLIPGATAVLEVPPYPDPLPGDPVPARASASGRRFLWPVEGGRVLSAFGAPRSTHRHQGIDIAGRPGQPVRAAARGRVVYRGSTLRGYGKTLIIAHDDEVRSLYAHNSVLLVREGQRVQRGQVIARVGRTGNASTEHCHFEIRRNDVPIDPLPYLREERESTR
jgi:murein DD-endopeptidase MepM/ murein hydrolase activator NlpD